jgi:hypothetical protein
MDEHCLRSCHGWKRAACAPRNNRSSPRNEKTTSYRTPAQWWRELRLAKVESGYKRATTAPDERAGAQV